jgi:hypothetical protein
VFNNVFIIIQETQQKLDKVSYKLQESLGEIEQVKKDAQNIVKSCQQGREDRTQQLGKFLC